MDRAVLERHLREGKTLEQIGKIVGKSPSTLSYWTRKHDLRAPNSTRCAPKGGIRREVLEEMVREGCSMQQIADRVGFSISGVRHWLRKYELQTARVVRLAETAGPRSERARSVTLSCARHGVTEFRLSARGGYRCLRCSSEAVSRRRRRVKRILIDEAGGRCRLCGYDRYPGALHFHHLDRGEKSFHLSRSGVTRSLASARAEAQKCVLLCSNCHAEVEGGIVGLRA